MSVDGLGPEKTHLPLFSDVKLCLFKASEIHYDFSSSPFDFSSYLQLSGQIPCEGNNQMVSSENTDEERRRLFPGCRAGPGVSFRSGGVDLFRFSTVVWTELVLL